MMAYGKTAVRSRRTVLGIGGASLAGSVAGGCDLLATDPAGDPDGSDGYRAAKPMEAAMLAELVERGELPKLEERLPAEPLVVQPNDRVGTYGGEWRVTANTASSVLGQSQNKIAGYENFVRWDSALEEVIPNVADSWDVNADSSVYVFHLHPGIRWSDGEPFTADDVVFAVEDVLMNAELNPVPSFGEMSAKKLDDYTVELTFAEPNGLFILTMATEGGNELTDYPRHYLEQYHATYNEAVDDLVREAGLDDWTALFVEMGGNYSFGNNPDKPSIKPWVLESRSDTQVVVVRNPFYWKVDPDGSQLPYLDRVIWELIDEEETILLKIANGELDFEWQELVNRPVLAQSRESGDYSFVDVVPGLTSTLCFYLNLSHKDPVKREIFNNRDFRIGLSYAVNRTDIRNTVYQRQGEPWQIAPRRESSFYDEEMATQYLEYDVEKANEYLDRVAPEKDSRGIRLGPDGQPITFQVDVNSDTPTWVDEVEFVVDNWRQVGVDARANSMSPSLAVERGKANQHDAAVWWAEGGLDAVILVNPYNYLPTTPPYSFFSIPWAAWWETDGKEGEEPPEPMREQVALYNELRATADPDEQRQLMTQVLELSKEYFVGIGTVAPTLAYGVLSNRTQNFGKTHTSGTAWVYMDPAPSNPCQYFVTET